MKKDFIMGPIRVPRDMAQEYAAALEFYGRENPEFRRDVMQALIEHYHHRDLLLSPLQFRCYAGAFEEGLTPARGNGGPSKRGAF